MLHNWNVQVIKGKTLLKFPNKETGEMESYFEKEATLGEMLIMIKKSILKNRER